MNLEKIREAAKLIRNADALLIGTGAGMGVDSGLGTFRGRNAGIWPPLERMKMEFTAMSNPQWFDANPHLAWAFWHFRWTSYSKAKPHRGYELLRQWGSQKDLFSFTSNIDGHWIDLGVNTFEVHGSVRWMQCQDSCKDEVWETDLSQLKLEKDDRAEEPLPKCIHCGGGARPAVLMFNDYNFCEVRSDAQEREYAAFLEKTKGKKLVLIEIGAGLAVPTVRNQMRRVSRQRNAPLIRLNLDDCDLEGCAGVALPMGALEALEQIEAAMKEL